MKKIWGTIYSRINNRVKMSNVFTSDEQKAYKEKRNIWALTTHRWIISAGINPFG